MVQLTLTLILTLTFTLTLNRSTDRSRDPSADHASVVDRSVPKRTKAPNPNVNLNPKTKHRPKHGPNHCFGTEARTETQTMFRSIPKQCFGISYSMPLKRGHRIANTEAVLRLSPNPNLNPNPKKKHRPKHGPKHCFGTEAWTEAQTMFRSIPCFGINYSMRHRIVKKARA